MLGPGINWQGNLRGSGGVRIEGTFEGEIALRGLVVVGETGRITCEHVRANTIIVAGAVRGLRNAVIACTSGTSTDESTSTGSRRISICATSGKIGESGYFSAPCSAFDSSTVIVTRAGGAAGCESSSA